MMRIKRIGPFALASALIVALLTAPAAPALTFKQIPATTWGHIYAGSQPSSTQSAPSKSKNLEVKSKFSVKYNNFPEWAKKEVQASIDVWSANFKSSVVVSVDASWGRSSSWGVLGSARPGSFFSAFSGAPDPSLWYPSALANALAGRDLDLNDVSLEDLVISWAQDGDSPRVVGQESEIEYSEIAIIEISDDFAEYP